VLRGSAFVAHAVPNGSFTGAAAASLIGVNTLIGLGVFSVGGALGIGLLGRRGRHDVATVAPFPVELGFLLLVALVTTMTVPVVGTALIFSLMIGPPAAARSFTNRPWIAIALSVAIALIVVWAAIALSYQTNWPVGFFVGMASAAAYAAAQRMEVRAPAPERAGAPPGQLLIRCPSPNSPLASGEAGDPGSSGRIAV
jgi:zinc/manganese transport system permease protein